MSRMINLCSDNMSSVFPQILSALTECNQESARPYGADQWTESLTPRFQVLFGNAQLRAFPVTTGTSANALSIATLVAPYQAVYCHEKSHINEDECGAPEFFAGGTKLIPLSGEGGKLEIPELADLLAQFEWDTVHQMHPAMVGITQPTESGTLYTLNEIAEIAEVAHRFGCKLHMDGARFANALVALDCSPAQMTWQAGVDVLSFGATKNGAMGAEAVIFFDQALASGFNYRQKRGGHLLSKMRYVSAQLHAYLDEDLWLNNARHANAASTVLAKALETAEHTQLVYPQQVNEVFVSMPMNLVSRLRNAGFVFYEWPAEASGQYRLVTSFDTRLADLDTFTAIISS